MGHDFSMNISIPTDDSGYNLLKCSHCGVLFKITPTDIEDERVLAIYCPSCGLTSESYITEDILDLALIMAKNKAMDLIHDEFRKIEKGVNKGPVTFKIGKKPKHETENPIRSGIESLEITTYSCCNRTAKIKPMLKITGSYCTFCGVKNYEVE